MCVKDTVDALYNLILKSHTETYFT